MHLRLHPVRRSAAAFGFSRPTVYAAGAALARGGLSALVPRKPGPRRAHKLDAEVMAFLQALRATEGTLGAGELARRVRTRFGRTVQTLVSALVRQPGSTAAPVASAF